MKTFELVVSEGCPRSYRAVRPGVGDRELQAVLQAAIHAYCRPL